MWKGKMARRTNRLFTLLYLEGISCCHTIASFQNAAKKPQYQTISIERELQQWKTQFCSAGLRIQSMVESKKLKRHASISVRQTNEFIRRGDSQWLAMTSPIKDDSIDPETVDLFAVMNSSLLNRNESNRIIHENNYTSTVCHSIGFLYSGIND